jgi:hypothetical protein
VARLLAFARTRSSVGLKVAFGWWWADPIGALAMTIFIVKEGREAWRGDDHSTESDALVGEATPPPASAG